MRGDSLELRWNMAGTPLGEGKAMQIRSSDIWVLARLKAGRILMLIIWLTLSVSSIGRAETSGTITFSDIERSVVSVLESKLSGPGRNIEVLVQPPRAIPEECDTFSTSINTPSVSASGRVVLIIKCDNNSVRQMFIQAQVKLSGPYLVSSRDIPAGTTITRNMLQISTGNITGQLDDIFDQEEDLLDKVLTRSLREGEVFLKRNIEESKLISRGQNVTFESIGTAFRISGTAIAMQSGTAGEQISLKLPSNKVISGIIIGPGKISIH